MSLAIGQKFMVDGIEYKVFRRPYLRPNHWTYLFYRHDTAYTKTFSEQQILEALAA